MSETRKSRCIFLVSLCLSALVIWVVLFFNITGERTVEEDGLVQNTRVYLSDISWDKEKESLWFTLHNDTWHTYMDDRDYRIEIKKNGEWETATPRMQRHPDINFTRRAFSDQGLGRDFLAEEQLPGEYRVILNIGVRSDDDKTGIYAVGYFSIP